MPTYAYRAIEDGGRLVSGALTAENHQVALRMLDEKALHPVSVEEAGARSITGGRKRVKLKYLTTFYRQLSDLLRSGVPMLRALEVLCDERGSTPAMCQVVKETREDVTGGATLADAMGKHPHIFKDLHCSMIRAGELGGFLEDVLARLSAFAERQDDLRNKLIGAMIYPALLMTAGVGVVTIIMTLVVPKLRAHLRPESFNVMTHLVFGTSDLIANYYWLLILGFFVVVAGVSALRRSKPGARFIAMVSLRAPGFGKLNTMVAVSRFCRILGTMLQNGVPILQSLKISKDSAGNEILAGHIEEAAESVRRGEPLSTPLDACGMFPPDIISMIAVAEESNNLENVLVQIADTQELRTARTIDLTVRLVEPLLLMFMAAMVGTIAFALLLPILTMGSQS